MDNLSEIQSLISSLLQREQITNRNRYPVPIQNVPGPSGVRNEKQNTNSSLDTKRNRRPQRSKKVQPNTIQGEHEVTSSTCDLRKQDLVNTIEEKIPTQRKSQSKSDEQNTDGQNEIPSLLSLSTSNPYIRQIENPACTGAKKLDNGIKMNETSSKGTFIRSRNTNSKYIRLRSFFKNGKKPPCIFSTDFTLFKLFENLNDSPKDSLRSRGLKKKKERESTSKELNRASFGEYISDNETEKGLEYNCQLYMEKAPKKSPRVRDSRRKKKRESSNKELDTSFADYISDSEAEKGLENGTLVKGFIRINPKSFKDSYVNNENSSLPDYYISSVRDRNRSLEGDEVVLKLKPKEEWVNGQKTATVVFIKQKVHSRVVVGNLKPSEKPKSNYAIFYPRDKRCPILQIPEVFWPYDFKKYPKRFENILFVGTIVKWDSPSYAEGILTETLGMSGDLEVETLSILREYCLDVTPFSEEIKTGNLCLTNEIPQKEFDYRADLRTRCVFTIDPETARDLDDAVSVDVLPNGNYEIGVHISDASYYLNEGSELDQMVSKKATTIYMTNSVFHMLPEELCLHCSLLPGQDKLAFSVFWEMNINGEILNKRFSRSIVNSCAKLSYEHAQKMIDNPNEKISSDELPEIYNNFSSDDLSKTVHILQTIAVKLRKKRIDNGALKIDQTKLFFSLEPDTGEPLDFRVYENKAAHRLIEEFMLLANITVAEKIYEHFPDIAFLRCHEPPKQTMLIDLKNLLESFGIHIDISSSGAIGSSMKKYETEDYAGVTRSTVLSHLTAKAMTRARYFCASSSESEFDFKHYALSVPIYTHFTSPIRRYADIMVHRLLAASLYYQDHPQWDVQYVADIASNCNGQKYNAKRAGEASAELYLAHYIESHKPFIQDCAVVDIKDRSFDAIVLNTGSVIRIYQNNCEEGTTWKVTSIPLSKQDLQMSGGEIDGTKSEFEKRRLKLKVIFPKTYYYPSSTFDIEIFTIVKISLEKKKNTYKLEGTLLRPLQNQVFHRKE